MKNITGKRIFLFLLITSLFLILCSFYYYKTRSTSTFTVLMLTPTISTIITRLSTKEGLNELYIKPNFKKNVNWYLMAYLLTPVVAYAGAVVYFLHYPDQLDLSGPSMGLSTDEYVKMLISIPLAMIINPLAGLLECFGEELAWRGYLLPKLCQKMPTYKAAICTGIIWGLWHAPIIAMGYNYGVENALFGILTMLIFCIVLGMIAAYLFFKSKTVWVAVIFHAALNGMARYAPSVFLMSEKSNPFIGPDPTGYIGGSGFIVLSILCFVAMYKNQERFEI